MTHGRGIVKWTETYDTRYWGPILYELYLVKFTFKQPQNVNNQATGAGAK